MERNVEKKEFFNVEVEIVKLDTVDVITTSGNGDVTEPDEFSIF